MTYHRMKNIPLLAKYWLGSQISALLFLRRKSTSTKSYLTSITSAQVKPNARLSPSWRRILDSSMQCLVTALFAIGQEMMNTLQAAKFKAEEQAKEQNKEAALPSSTQKRYLMRWVLLQVIGWLKQKQFMKSHSLQKRSRSETEDTRGRGYLSPGGKRNKFVCQTPKTDPEQDYLDAFSLSSTLEGTGLSKGYQH